MLRFLGVGGELFAVGAPFQFEAAPMVDCGGGFTWRVADESLRLWDATTVVLEVRGDEGWEAVPATAEPFGRVRTERCWRDRYVRASGTCRLVALAARAERWECFAPLTLAEDSRFGLTHRETRSLVGDQRVRLDGVGEASTPARALVVLPTSTGAFLGEGDTSADQQGHIVVAIDQEGVQHVRH